jgi:class 3 adenylate cyclase
LGVAACRNCGTENLGDARFCQACGESLDGDTAVPRAVRKTVTILFADVAGSTALGEKLDPEAVRSVMSRYFEEMRAVLEHHGGTVEKFIGDAVMAVFGAPVVHENDAERAVRAALVIGHTIVEDGAIEVRIGVNTGKLLRVRAQRIRTRRRCFC